MKTEREILQEVVNRFGFLVDSDAPLDGVEATDYIVTLVHDAKKALAMPITDPRIQEFPFLSEPECRGFIAGVEHVNDSGLQVKGMIERDGKFIALILDEDAHD